MSSLILLPRFPALAALALSLPFGCGRHEIHREFSEPEPMALRVASVESSEFGGREEVIGTVRPRLAAAVSAKVSGTIVEAPLDPGASVRAGDPLARIDAREIQGRLDQARANAVEARGDFERVSRLAASNAVSRRELDAAVARRDAAEGALIEAETMLQYMTITAPFHGVIARKLVEVGDLAQPGRVLFELEDPSTLRLEVEVPEQLGGLVKVGQTLSVRIDAAPFEGEGVVDEIEPTIDRASRTFPARLVLPDDPGLRSGQFGRASVPLPAGGGLWAPEEALISRGHLDLVYVVAGGDEPRARLRVVRTGRRENGRVEILAGIEAGESVALQPPHALADGQRVTVQS